MRHMQAHTSHLRYVLLICRPAVLVDIAAGASASDSSSEDSRIPLPRPGVHALSFEDLHM